MNLTLLRITRLDVSQKSLTVRNQLLLTLY